MECCSIHPIYKKILGPVATIVQIISCSTEKRFSLGTRKIRHCIFFSINWQNMVGYIRHGDVIIIVNVFCRISRVQVQLHFIRLKMQPRQ